MSFRRKCPEEMRPAGNTVGGQSTESTKNNEQDPATPQGRLSHRPFHLRGLSPEWRGYPLFSTWLTTCLSWTSCFGQDKPQPLQAIILNQRHMVSPQSRCTDRISLAFVLLRYYRTPAGSRPVLLCCHLVFVALACASHSGEVTEMPTNLTFLRELQGSQHQKSGRGTQKTTVTRRLLAQAV